MMTFKIHFHRYRNGQSRLSSPQWVQAETILDAMDVARNILTGLVEGDPNSKYLIASVETHGLRGEECNGARMFETSEEFSARIRV